MFTLRDVLFVFFKRKYVILFFFLTVIAGGFIALRLTAPTYAATAKVLVKVGREDVYVPAIPGDSVMTVPMMSLIREQQLNSEIQIITSDILVEKLVQTMTPQGLYPSMFVVHPWYTPKGFIQSLIGLYNWLQDYFAPLSADPTPEQRAIKRFASKDLFVKGTGDSNVIDITVYSKIPSVAEKAANATLDLYMDERSKVHANEEGSIFENQLRDIENRLSAAQTALLAFRKQNSLTDVDEERTQLLKRVAEIRSMIVSMESSPADARKLSGWKTELRTVEGKLGDLSALELDYVRKVQDVEVLRKSREMYLQKLEEYRIDSALSQARIGNVSVISRAALPSSPVSPKLWLVLIAMLAVGIGGGIGLAFLIEFIDDSLENDRDVRNCLDLPVLAKVGELGKA